MGSLFVQGSAVLSECGAYRYRLERRWDEGKPLNFVMLNPSTADANADDPTITRCITRAQRLGFPALVVTNLFAFRSTQPMALRKAADPVGPENDGHLLEVALGAGMVLCAWGFHGALNGRGVEVESLLRDWGADLYALKLSQAGWPCHPLYLPYELEPMPYGGSP